MTTTSSTTSSTSTAATTTTSSTTSSNASIGQSILSSLNANGADIDTDTLVTNLTAAQKSALETPITTKQATNTTQISTAASIASDLTTFSQSLNTLISGGTLQTQPVSSDSTTVSVSAISGTLIGSLSGTVNVTQLAQAQTIESQPVDTTTGFSSGSITITTTGGATATLTAGTDFTDMSSLVTAINSKTSTTGVTASIVTDSNGSHLVMKGATGAQQGFSVSGSEDLSAFSYTPTDGDISTANVATGSGMQRLQAAQDLNFTIDGVAYTRASNSVSDAVPGVQMNFIKTGSVSLSSSRPTSAITEAVNDFVSAYNELLSEINDATAASGSSLASSSSSSTAGPLQGNSALRSLKQQLSQLTTTPLNASGTIRTLAQLGVSTAQDGTLSVNATTLSNMLTNYPDDVEAMFVTSQSSSASGVIVTSTAGATASGVYTVGGITPATNGGNATGSINGVAMTASSWNLTAASGSGADGLKLQILSSAPTTATITINQGLGGALQLIHDTMLGTTGALTTLQSSLQTQKTSLSDALTKADAQVTVYHDRLVTQFTQMNTLVSGYKATQSYLTQQVDLWTKSDD